MMKHLSASLALLLVIPAIHAEDPAPKSPETFEFEWEGKKIMMQQYFIVFLKSGPTRGGEKEELAKLQSEHLAYLGGLYNRGIIDLNGPTGDKSEIRGFSVYNVATQEEAETHASNDPMVKAGRLVIEVHPWWVAKGSSVK